VVSHSALKELLDYIENVASKHIQDSENIALYESLPKSSLVATAVVLKEYLKDLLKPIFEDKLKERTNSLSEIGEDENETME